MIVTKKSGITGKIHQMEIPVTQQEITKWERGNVKIQDFFPNLSYNQREFLMTGVTPEEWEELFG